MSEVRECTCGGALLEGKSTYRASGDDYSLILENIPAYKCTRCDKVLFDEEVVARVQKMVNRVDRDVREIISGQDSVHLYDYE